MANYSLVADYSFRPFTFDEMVKPMLMYKDEYEKREADYLELQKNADKFKYLSDSLPEGSRAKKIYDDYANALKTYADDFSRNGLSITNKRGLQDLKRRYEGEIGALEKAVLLKKSQEDAQMQALMKDPTMLFSMDAFTTPVDKYLENPDLAFTPYSGSTLTAYSAGIAGVLAKELRDVIQGKPSNYLAMITKKYGYTSSEIARALQSPETMRDYEILDTLLNNVVGASPVGQWQDENTRRRAMEYARMGLWNAIGSNQVSVHNLPKGSTTGNKKKDDKRELPDMNWLDDIYKQEFGTDEDEETETTVVTAGDEGSGSSNVSRRNGGRYIKARGAKKALGGRLNVYAPGGPVDAGGNTEDGSDNATKYVLSPAYQQHLDNLTDDQYIRYIDKVIGEAGMDRDNINDYQIDSLLYERDRAIINSLNEAVRDKVVADWQPHPMYNTRPVAILNNFDGDSYEELNNFLNYFSKDEKTGKYNITDEGKTALGLNASRHVYSPWTQTSVPIPKSGPSSLGPWSTKAYEGREGHVLSPYQNTRFKDFVTKHGLEGIITGNPTKEEQNRFDELLRIASNTSADMIVGNEFWRSIDSSENLNLKQTLSFISDNGAIQGYKRIKDKDTGSYKVVPGEKVKLSDIDGKYEGSQIIYGEHGYFLQVNYGGGKKILIPFENIDGNAALRAKNNLAQAREYEARKAKGTLIYQTLDGVKPADAMIEEELNKAFKNLLSSLISAKSKEEEVERGGYY